MQYAGIVKSKPGYIIFTRTRQIVNAHLFVNAYFIKSSKTKCREHVKLHPSTKFTTVSPKPLPYYKFCLALVDPAMNKYRYMLYFMVELPAHNFGLS